MSSRRSPRPRNPDVEGVAVHKLVNWDILVSRARRRESMVPWMVNAISHRGRNCRPLTHAILRRWSMSGLEYIKRLAWRAWETAVEQACLDVEV